jgi:hypothetical protein
MPPIQDLAIFICEACTVRAVLQRELRLDSNDQSLVMLERIRVIDMGNNWSAGTHGQYQGKLKVVRQFEESFGLSILHATHLERPPASRSIPLAWAQGFYSLRPGQARGTNTVTTGISHNAVRGLRSAVTQFYSWEMQIVYPDSSTKDWSGRAVRTQGCLPTDTLAYAFMSHGMRQRLGDEAKPSKALLLRHVLWIDVFLQEVYASTDDPEYRAEIARAALANLTAWLGWLRAMEIFSLHWADVHVVEPEDGPVVGLPALTGAVAFRLLPQTKSDRTKTADVLIAYNTFSGLSIGKWCHRLRESLGFDEFPTDSTPIFVTREGTPWTSNYFRTTYLIPFLEMQRTNGDMHFTSCDGSPGNTIADHFWSLHSYRRGGRTHVSRRRVGCFRKATAQEIAEHGRWRASRTSMDMPTLYLEWTYLDRISITLLCM